MKLIAITTHYFWDGEPSAVASLLESRRFWRIHLRKPEATKEEMRELIEHIPPIFYPYLSLHDHFELAEELGIGGIHLNSRNPHPLPQWNGITSRSCHSVAELYAHDSDTDYLFLSPVFDSISKPGYRSAFRLADIKQADISSKNIFALGGVTFDSLPALEAAGFDGAAMLGAAWADCRPSHNHE